MTKTKKQAVKARGVRTTRSPEYKAAALARAGQIGVDAAARGFGIHKSHLYGRKQRGQVERQRDSAEQLKAAAIVQLKQALADLACGNDHRAWTVHRRNARAAHIVETRLPLGVALLAGCDPLEAGIPSECLVRNDHDRNSVGSGRAPADGAMADVDTLWSPETPRVTSPQLHSPLTTQTPPSDDHGHPRALPQRFDSGALWNSQHVLELQEAHH